ncbi:MAG: hypothetical protein M5R36_02360 [Deltaproteobacteria bacterium]|nr:hypothetical protein [Deltaproteobacteria bacterium]
MGVYLETLRQRTNVLDVRIDWTVIRADRISAYSMGKRMGLQIADAVASGFFKAAERSHFGFTEDRYARILRPTVYRHKGQAVGYGLKFWPRDFNASIDNRFEWLAGY